MAAPTSNFTEPTFVSRRIEPPVIAKYKISIPVVTIFNLPANPSFGLASAAMRACLAIPIQPIKAPPPPMGRTIVSTLPIVYKESPTPPTEPPPLTNTEWNILWLQRVQLSKDNFPYDILDVSSDRNQLAELSSNEGHFIPFMVRTGPVGKPDPGLMKRYTAVEINGDGRAFVMIWIRGRLVAWGNLFAQEAPKNMRRLNIPRGLGNGYDIDIQIAFQGRLTGYEVFYEIIDGGGA